MFCQTHARTRTERDTQTHKVALFSTTARGDLVVTHATWLQILNIINFDILIIPRSIFHLCF